MSQWTMNDDAAGKPSYLNTADKAATIGVDSQEAATPGARTRGLNTPGWVLYKTYTDGNGNVRHKSEVLVAAGSFNTDGQANLDDDLNLAPPFNVDYPLPGSGNWVLAATALNNVSFNDGSYAPMTVPVEQFYNQSTPSNQIGNQTTGLKRFKYDGNFCQGAMDTVTSYDTSFFNTRAGQELSAIQDTYGGWGHQIDGSAAGEHNFSVEWKGYIRLNNGNVINDSGSQFNGYGGDDWQFFIESDDTSAVWIGDAAKAAIPDPYAAIVTTSNTLSASAPIRLDSVWYPIRIWFSEFSGGCSFQLYAISSQGDKWQLGDNNIDMLHNSTNGY